MTARLQGRAGLRRLWSSLARWQVGARWYALALLIMPVLFLAVLCPLAAFLDPAFAPRFQWPLFASGLVAGSFEEIGWTGLSTPRFLAAQRLFMAGLSLGLALALWHALVDFRQNFNRRTPAIRAGSSSCTPPRPSSKAWSGRPPLRSPCGWRWPWSCCCSCIANCRLMRRCNAASIVTDRQMNPHGDAVGQARAEELGSLMERCHRPTGLPYLATS